jgi:hypothetical protein
VIRTPEEVVTGVALRRHVPERTVVVLAEKPALEKVAGNLHQARVGGDPRHLGLGGLVHRGKVVPVGLRLPGDDLPVVVLPGPQKGDGVSSALCSHDGERRPEVVAVLARAILRIAELHPTVALEVEGDVVRHRIEHELRVPVVVDELELGVVEAPAQRQTLERPVLSQSLLRCLQSHEQQEGRHSRSERAAGSSTRQSTRVARRSWARLRRSLRSHAVKSFIISSTFFPARGVVRLGSIFGLIE